MSIRHVKLHRALYKLAAKDERLSQIIMEAIVEYEKNLIFIALAGSKMYQLGCKRNGFDSGSGGIC